MSLPTLHNPITALTDKHRAIMAAMVYGLDGKVAQKHGLEPGKALAPQTVADHFHVRRAYVRTLMADPLFKAEMTRHIACKRIGYMPHSLDRLAELVDSDNESIALRAASTMLGENGQSPTVNVSVNNQTAVINHAQIRPGYVVRLPADLASPQTPAISPGKPQHTPQTQSISVSDQS